MTHKNLEEVLQAAGNTVNLLRNAPTGAYVYPVVAPEFTNWRSEQQAWRETAVLFDQSHHMAELLVEGPGAYDFLQGLAINSFANFAPGKAKQFVPVSHDGYVIGDVIIFRESETEFNLVGRAPTVSWVEFNAATGSHDVKLTRDDRSPSRPGGKPVVRRHYRFQVQGPNAPEILNRLNGGPTPDIKFFNMDYITVAGRKVRALRHGMAGVPGLRGRRRSRPAPGRFPRLRHQHAGIRLDPFAAARRLHRRGDEALSRMAARQQLRGDRHHRRQLRLGQYRGLLPDALRARLRHLREVRP
jgi:vanillate/3-O-methylgallate O-demethylase